MWFPAKKEREKEQMWKIKAKAMCRSAKIRKETKQEGKAKKARKEKKDYE